MGNETADLIRDELGRLLVYRFGDLKRASQEIGIPYKTLYRAVTENGQDRVQRVPLDTVLEIADALGITIAELYNQAVGGQDYALAAKTRSSNRGETHYE
ncbi:helix-turn-helix domain-containing protein [Leucobacter albus]|uniref:Helix-turn-helix domain-containing protein n=1 Tax=Leucobacter albus TaxID=272210 RepID=A0ABW3TNZ2_9MICO